MTDANEQTHRDINLILTPRGIVFGVTAGSADGPVVLGLHGYGSHHTWETWRLMLDPLAQAGYFVVLVDMPGWGMSEGWDDEKPLDGREAMLAILDALDVEQAILLGKSWGGGIALEVASEHPDRVTALLLTAPAFLGHTAVLERLTKPALIAWAKDDPTIPVSRATDLANALPTAELIIYDTGGHSAAQHNIDDFAPRAIRFLAHNQ